MNYQCHGDSVVRAHDGLVRVSVTVPVYIVPHKKYMSSSHDSDDLYDSTRPAAGHPEGDPCYDCFDVIPVSSFGYCTAIGL